MPTRFCLFHRPFLRYGLIALCALLLSACSDKSDKSSDSSALLQQDPAAVDPALIVATENAWQHGSNVLHSAVGEAQQLHDRFEQLLDNPSDETLIAAQQQWHQAHNQYLMSAPFIALGYSNPGLFGQLQTLDFKLDAWPIQPGYLDYFDVYAHSGIVNDIAVPITAEAIRQQHGFSDSTDVSLGYHAIAYLLWGEKNNRKASDYAPVTTLQAEQQSAGLTIVDLPNNRRRTLLALLSTLLLDDLQRFTQQWQKGNNPALSYSLAQQYHSLQARARLQLLQGAAHQLLGLDLFATQVTPLLSSNDNEVLHNRFAGHTAQALIANIKGLQALFLDESGSKKTENLATWVLGEEDAQQWQTALSSAVKHLEKLPIQLDTADQKQLKPLVSALQTATSLLQPKPINAGPQDESEDE